MLFALLQAFENDEDGFVLALAAMDRDDLIDACTQLVAMIGSILESDRRPVEALALHLGHARRR